ncbi:MAG: putative membrane protein [Myxococcota bacterium]|jgi:uncharacterized membrane protein
MAGIGFRLREIVQAKTYTEWAQLYFYSAVIFAGPWLSSVLCLAALSVFALPDLQQEGVALFTITVVYCYAFSLITTGAVQLPVTRYVADRLYVGGASGVVPSFVSVVILTAPIQALSAAAFLAFCDVSLAYKVSAMGLYVVISLIWMAMIYLSAAKDYGSIVLGFILGYATSFGLGQLFASWFGVEGLLSGFLAGQTLLCFWLVWRIFEEFANSTSFNLEFVGAFKAYPNLAWAGFFYSAGIWVDKLIFWFGGGGIRVHSLFYTHFPYDSAMFFAYLTIVPSLALFLVRVEVDFYEAYKAYFGGILNKEPLASIESRRAEMVTRLKVALYKVLIYQGLCTIAVLVLMPWFLDWMNISRVHTNLFRVAAIAGVVHVMLLLSFIILLYFDFRGAVMWLSLLFFVSNALLSWYTVDKPHLFGMGYLGAAAITLACSSAIMHFRLTNLEYVTFVQQPVSQRRSARAKG